MAHSFSLHGVKLDQGLCPAWLGLGRRRLSCIGRWEFRRQAGRQAALPLDYTQLPPALPVALVASIFFYDHAGLADALELK